MTVDASITRSAADVIPPDVWSSWPDEKLLDLRISQLGVTIEGSVLERDVILIDRRTNRILDIIENIAALATGQ